MQVIELIVFILVGAEGFEPPTLWSQTRCATRLRYAPTAFSLSHRVRIGPSKRAEHAVGTRAEQRMHQAPEDPGQQKHGQQYQRSEHETYAAEKQPALQCVLARLVDAADQ